MPRKPAITTRANNSNEVPGDNAPVAGGETPASIGDVVEHVRAMIFSGKPPSLSPVLAAVPGLEELSETLAALRRQLGSYARGDFSRDISTKGAVAGMLKTLQANMRHLTWQMEQVSAGDLTQRVDFMGEFSHAFNNMVQQLDDALTALHQKEQELTAITMELQQEVERRGAALTALQKSEENFKYLAEHDPLTGILNRRSFFARATMELARNTIMEQYSAMALMDVDHFKVFNDTYGHPNGDLALKHIAKLGASSLRDNDIMGRIGGEEFAFFFSRANTEQARHATNRIRSIIESNPVRLGDRNVYVTASIGVVSFLSGQVQGSHTGLLERAMELADQALYRAKAEGRNRVCMTDFLQTA